MTSPRSLPEADLDRRINRAAECGRGLKISDSDLDMLIESGAVAVIAEYCEFLRNPRDFPLVERREFCPDCAPYVYFIQAGEAGPIKIGLTRKPRQRVTEHQTSNHETLHLRALIAAPPATESMLHRFYGPEHIRGEWFRPSPRLRAFVREVAAA